MYELIDPCVPAGLLQSLVLLLPGSTFSISCIKCVLINFNSHSPFRTITFFLAPAPKSSYQVLKESDTDVQVLPNYSTPQKTDSYFNPKMKLNRWENREWEDTQKEWWLCSEEYSYILKNKPCEHCSEGRRNSFFSNKLVLGKRFHLDMFHFICLPG